MKWILPIGSFFVFLGIFYTPQDKYYDGEQLVVWDVGQGQMVTYMTEFVCYHFDLGGERFPEKQFFDLCKKKKNKVYYTHWDYDHINFSSRVYRIFPSLCRTQRDIQWPRSLRKKRMIQKIPLCQSFKEDRIKEIHPPVQARTSNESSRIFVIKNKVLIPGDSTSRMEKYWAKKISPEIQALIVGHHGSQSSTSSFLLKNLPALKLAVVSARKKRYGHPHPLMMKRLKNKGVILFRTERFGSIRIPLSSMKALPL